jgi:hypothetical protein
MKATPVELEKYLRLLEENPRAIATATKGVAAARLNDNPDKNSWSVNDILAHLRRRLDTFHLCHAG